MSELTRAAKELLGPRWTTRLRCLVRGYPLPRWGNLRRATPFSSFFGFERGTPVDRFYLHRFLEANREAIRGDVLEIQMSTYTRRYGSALGLVESLDVNPEVRPTYVCDLARADTIIAAERYDCFLMPATLSFLRDLDASLAQALRLIKPGGVILASSVCLVPLTPDAVDYWHLSVDGWREVTRRAWRDCEVDVVGHGNHLVATAAMLGLAMEELSQEELLRDDPRYPVTVTVRCRRSR